jgi:hypothetical protein
MGLNIAPEQAKLSEDFSDFLSSRQSNVGMIIKLGHDYSLILPLQLFFP